MKRTIKKMLKPIIPTRIWTWLRYKFRSKTDRRYWKWTGIPINRLPTRKALVRFDIQEGCFIESFWIEQVSGDGIEEFGPAIIVVVHGSEILKFDCYGEGNAHFHIATEYPRGIRNGFFCRLMIPEPEVEAQIDRTIFELENNLGHYLLMHPRRKVRKIVLDREALSKVCKDLRSKLMADEMAFGYARRKSAIADMKS